MINPIGSASLAFVRCMLLLLLLPAAGHALEYERDIQPIFEKKCYDCHSAQADKVKGGLKFDDAEHFLGRFSKNSVIIPGNWDASYLFVTITRPHDSDEAMPPEGKGDPLTPKEILQVANWIHEGAKVGREKGEEGPDDYKPDDFLKFDESGQLIIAGVTVGEATDKMKPEGDPGSGSTMQEKPTPTAPVMREWSNLEGTTIRAKLLGVEGGKAMLELENGQVAPYPLEKLSEESRKLAGELATKGGDR